MLSAGFLCQKWPKRHAYVVEECRALDVRNVVPHLALLGQLRPGQPGQRIRQYTRFWRAWGSRRGDAIMEQRTLAIARALLR